MTELVVACEILERVHKVDKSTSSLRKNVMEYSTAFDIKKRKEIPLPLKEYFDGNGHGGHLKKQKLPKRTGYGSLPTTLFRFT